MQDEFNIQKLPQDINKMKRMNQEELKKLHGMHYVNEFNKRNAHPYRLERLIKLIKFNNRDIVLDAGCGNGILLDFINKKIKFYYGVDFSREFIRVSVERQKANKISNAKFFNVDIEEFCKKNKERFDKIFAFDLLEHLYDDQFIKIFSMFYYSLKPNGKIFIHTPNRDYILEVLKNKKILKKQIEHIGIRNATEYLKLLKKTGFKNIKTMYLPHYIKLLSFFDFLRNIPMVGKYFEARLFIICKK